MGRRAWWIGLWIGLLAAGCGGDDGGGGTEAAAPGGGDRREGPPPAVDDPADDPPPGPDAGPPDVLPGTRQLVVEGVGDPVVRAGDTLELSVRYLTVEGDPVPGATIRGRLLDLDDRPAPSIGGSTLAAVTARTDGEGRAVLRLLAGDEPARFYVEAAADAAAPVYWTVTVAPVGSARLVVEIEAAPDVDLGRARVLLYPSPACEALAAGGAGAPAPHAELPPVEGGLRPIAETEVGAGVELSVQVLGFGRQGALVAGGCVDGVVVEAPETRIVVPIAAFPLEVKGRYDIEHHFDLGADRIAQDDLLDAVARIAGGVDPRGRGRAIVELVCDRADLNGAVCAALRAVAPGPIDEVIENVVDPALLDALAAFGDVYRLLRDLTVLGTLEVTATGVGPDGALPGNVHLWTGLRIVWRGGCRAVRLEDCTFDYRLGDLGVVERRELPQASFDARVDGDVLRIPEHRLALPVGRIAVALAEHWLLPAVLDAPAPVTIEDLVAGVLPCADIVARLPAGSLTVAECEDLLAGTLADLLRERLASLGEGVESFALEGTARLVDHDGDRRLDALVDGAWSGPVRGTFAACRAGFDCP